MRYDFRTNCAVNPHSVSLVFGSSMPAKQGDEIISVPATPETLNHVERAMIDLVEAANSSECRMVMDHAVEFEGLTVCDLRDFAKIIRAGGLPYPLPQEFTAESLDQVVATIIDQAPADLAEHATLAAINELVPNWKDALGDGSAVDDLVGDIDDVIAKLKAFKALCAVRGSA